MQPKTSRGVRHLLVSTGVVSLVLAAAAPAALAGPREPQAGAEDARDMWVCHATGSETNPWEFNLVSVNAQGHDAEVMPDQDVFAEYANKGALLRAIAADPAVEGPLMAACDEAAESHGPGAGDGTGGDTGNGTGGDNAGNGTGGDAGNGTGGDNAGNGTGGDNAGNGAGGDNAGNGTGGDNGGNGTGNDSAGNGTSGDDDVIETPAGDGDTTTGSDSSGAPVAPVTPVTPVTPAAPAEPVPAEQPRPVVVISTDTVTRPTTAVPAAPATPAAPAVGTSGSAVQNEVLGSVTTRTPSAGVGAPDPGARTSVLAATGFDHTSILAALGSALLLSGLALMLVSRIRVRRAA